MGDGVNKGEERFDRVFVSNLNSECRLYLELVAHCIGGRLADGLGFKKDCWCCSLSCCVVGLSSMKNRSDGGGGGRFEVIRCVDR